MKRFFAFAGFVLPILMFVADVAFAQQGTLPVLPGCGDVPNIPGCGPLNQNVIATSVIPSIAKFMLRLAAGLSLACIVWAGIQMMTALGDESKIGAQKKAILYALLGLGISITSQIYVAAVATYNYAIGDTNDLIIGGLLRYIIDIAMTMMNVILAFVVIYFGTRMVMAQGKTDEFNRARTGLFWSVAGAVVIHISYTLVRVVTSFFNL